MDIGSLLAHLIGPSAQADTTPTNPVQALLASARPPNSDDSVSVAPNVAALSAPPAAPEESEDAGSSSDDADEAALKKPGGANSVISKLFSSPYGKGLDSDAMAAAIAQKNSNLLGAGLAKAGDVASSAIAAGSGARVSEANPATDMLAQNAGAPVENLMLQRKAIDEQTQEAVKTLGLATEAERNDPKSTPSMLARVFLKKLGIDVSPTTSLADALPILTNLTKLNISENNMVGRNSRFDHQKDKDAKKEVQGYQKELNSDTKKLREEAETISMADNILAASKNDPIARNQIKTIVARISTGGQRLNMAEIKSATGSPDVQSTLSRILQAATDGTMTDKDMEDFKGVVAVYKKSTEQALNGRTDYYAKQMASNLGISKQEAKKKLLGEDTSDSVKPQSEPQPQATAIGVQPGSIIKDKKTGKHYLVGPKGELTPTDQ